MASIYESIAAIMSEIEPIAKGQKNAQQGFMYRGIDDVMNDLQPILARHHVFVVPEVLENTRSKETSARGNTLFYSIMKIKFTFFADDGSNIAAVLIGEGMDSGDKASNKAMSIALKYACLQVFCIPTKDTKDPDAESHEILGESAAKIHDQMNADLAELTKVMTATIGAVPAFNDSEKSKAREVMKSLKNNQESADKLSQLLQTYKARYDALLNAWRAAGGPTPRPEKMEPPKETNPEYPEESPAKPAKIVEGNCVVNDVEPPVEAGDLELF